MTNYLKRLLKTGSAYQVSDIVAKAIALLLLPVYTRHLTQADYGTAELMITLVILFSIVVRFGVGEAFTRFHFHDEDPERRRQLARTATGFYLTTTTATAAIAAIFSEPLSRLILGESDSVTLLIAVAGLWVFTNLEIVYALLRVDENARLYLICSLTNVGLTVCLTVYLVVFADQGARGLLAGNFAASAVILVLLWWLLRERIGLLPRGLQLRSMLKFGLPTVPAEVSVFALNVVDRLYLYRFQSEAEAGVYSLAIKLAAVVVIAVRAFQYAWPPLAYSIKEDQEAAKVYARITTYYIAIIGFIVVGLVLFGRLLIRIFAAPEFADAYAALPWVALGWGLYGLFLVLVVLAGRAGVTTRNFWAAAAGLITNLVLLVLLVEPLGIAGAGIALCGSYVVMLAVMYRLIRRLFPVDFEWRRVLLLTVTMAAAAVGGSFLPDLDPLGLLLRLAVLAALPLLLLAVGLLNAQERAALTRLVSGLRRGRWRAD